VSHRILVAGIGNMFLGDDGFGPEVARQLAGRWASNDVRVVDYGIRGMHLAYDLLDGCDALVLVDALPGEQSPGTVRVLEVGAEHLGSAGVDAHAMDPATVLASVHALGGTVPRTLVVGCVPADVSEGIGLSDAVSGAVAEASAEVVGLVEALLAEPTQPAAGY
jgi:hydrogenase maturation protease